MSESKKPQSRTAGATPEPIIVMKDVHKAFGKRVVSNGLDLTIHKGEFLAVIGRSGEGKSVLLKQMIGLIEPDSGEVSVGGVTITHTPESSPERLAVFKQCGYVFQFAALLDSLTVLENVALFQFEQGDSIQKITPLVDEKLIEVGLSPDIKQRYPSELSGGMRKRVGLARTLMQSPHVLIYDEPTTGLDPISVRMIHELMRKTHDERKATTVVISHDPDIFNYADRVAMLHEGKIIYLGDSQKIWEEENPYIYQFIRGLSTGPITLANEKVKNQ